MNFMSVFIEGVEKDRVQVQLSNGTTFWIPVDGTTVTRGERMSLGIRPEHWSKQSMAMPKLKAK